jgi:uncharacterized protein YndB with AHSA1/START domain
MGELKVTTPSDREIAMTRVFDAPRERVFEAWTKPDLIKRWLGAFNDWTMPVCEVDPRVGGAYRFVWRGPDGRDMGMGGIYREVARPERLVATERFDEPWYPGQAQVTTTLAEDRGKTTATTTVRYESREARDGVLQSPMREGVAKSYDKLAELLASQAHSGAEARA